MSRRPVVDRSGVAAKEYWFARPEGSAKWMKTLVRCPAQAGDRFELRPRERRLEGDGAVLSTPSGSVTTRCRPRTPPDRW